MPVDIKSSYFIVRWHRGTTKTATALPAFVRSDALPLVTAEELQLGPIIGQGAVGRVVLGRYKGVETAVKLILPRGWVPAHGYTWEHGVYEKLAAIQGTVVPQLLGHGYVNGGALGDLYFLAVQRVVGTQLSKLPRPFSAAVKAAALAALQQVHEQHVLHGDVSLRHFFLQPSATVMIIDFDHGRLDGTDVEFGDERAELQQLLE